MVTIIVAQDGSGDATKIQDAIDRIPMDNKERVMIHIKSGVYKEKVHIDQPFVSLIGEEPKKTCLTFDDYANKELDNGEKMGTFRSYSVFIGGDDCIIENITLKNSAGDGRIKGQALAAYVDADRIIFRNCILKGYQDTLFTGPLPEKPRIPNSFKGPGETKVRRCGRQYYDNCTIIGDVDFIFGSATAVFHQCTIFSRNRGMDINGYVTAASTPANQKYGYVFWDCRLESDAPENTVYLGRPWREHAYTAFINCWMGKHIHDEGWHNWNRIENEETARYYEYNSQGPGAKMNKRVKWSTQLTEEQVKEYAIGKILAGEDNWNPVNIKKL